MTQPRQRRSDASREAFKLLKRAMARAAFPAMVVGKADALERSIRYDGFSPVHAAMDDSRCDQISGDAAVDRQISAVNGREIFVIPIKHIVQE